MVKVIDVATEGELLSFLEQHKAENYFLGCFLNELDSEHDEYMVVVEQGAETVLLKLVLKTQEPIPNPRHIFNMA